MIVKSSGPNAMDDVKGSLTRDAFIRGEPMRRDKLVKAGRRRLHVGDPAFGLRAVAIKVDNAGDDYAGGFILPNDRVDVIKIYRDDERPRRAASKCSAPRPFSPTSRCWRSARPCKRRMQEGRRRRQCDAGARSAAGRAGDSRRTRRQRQLHLVLRSLVDSAGPAQTVGDQDASGSGLTIVRFGAPQTAAQ